MSVSISLRIMTIDCWYAISSWVPILTLSNIAKSAALLMCNFDDSCIAIFSDIFLISVTPAFVQLRSPSNSMQGKQKLNLLHGATTQPVSCVIPLFLVKI